MFPVKGGKWFTEMSVGKDLADYDSLVVLTHFKGHTMGGFGGSNKNIGIGCADGRIGKGDPYSRGFRQYVEHQHGRAYGAHRGIHEISCGPFR